MWSSPLVNLSITLHYWEPRISLEVLPAFKLEIAYSKILISLLRLWILSRMRLKDALFTWYSMSICSSITQLFLMVSLKMQELSSFKVIVMFKFLKVFSLKTSQVGMEEPSLLQVLTVSWLTRILSLLIIWLEKVVMISSQQILRVPLLLKMYKYQIWMLLTPFMLLKLVSLFRVQRFLIFWILSLRGELALSALIVDKY